jgi:hypothetical protein
MFPFAASPQSNEKTDKKRAAVGVSLLEAVLFRCVFSPTSVAVMACVAGMALELAQAGLFAQGCEVARL